MNTSCEWLYSQDTSEQNKINSIVETEIPTSEHKKKGSGELKPLHPERFAWGAKLHV